MEDVSEDDDDEDDKDDGYDKDDECGSGGLRRDDD